MNRLSIATRALGVGLILAFSVLTSRGVDAAETTLFDFEDDGQLAVWSNLELPDAKQKEPPAKIASSSEHATSGQKSLKLTFEGGRWPTITTTKVPADWKPFETFKASVTVKRDCLVGFTVLQEKSLRTQGWDGTISRWTKTALLTPGTHEVSDVIHPPNEYSVSQRFGKVVRLEIFMYAPHEGESIWIDNIRLSADAPPIPAPPSPQFRVAGTDLIVKDAIDLGKKLAIDWHMPPNRTLDEVEQAFRQRYEQLKSVHPGAVLASFRDGEKGYDPNAPDKVYAGWRDAYWSSHGPDGMTIERTDNRGHDQTHEIFMRHRSPLMRVDLSSIPSGASILAAELVIPRGMLYDKENNPNKANVWVVEPCNRDWQEYDVNAYEYAKDKFWREIGGRYYGKDPDFLPLYLAHGPSSDGVCVWDFSHAVRFWTDGQRANHGFMLHGDSHDWIRAASREAKAVKQRPAVLVIYEPKK